GEGCVGKTSLVLRYCENKFNDKHITTLQVRAGAGGEILPRVSGPGLGGAGGEAAPALLPPPCAPPAAGPAPLKTNSPLFFLQVKNWVKELRKMLGNEICLCIVEVSVDHLEENKSSIQNNQLFNDALSEVCAKHYHTSAKQNKGIEELFLDLCKRMIETAQVDERARGNGSSQSGMARRGVQIIDDEPQVQSTGGCCSSG
ncbi:RAB21 protein, partial [Pitta sordida]|nr:RAB21 protein [Pitta sordida]